MRFDIDVSVNAINNILNLKWHSRCDESKRLKKVSMIEEREGCYAFWKWRTRSIILNMVCDYDSTWTHLHLAKQNINKKKKIGDLQWFNLIECKQTKIT